MTATFTVEEDIVNATDHDAEVLGNRVRLGAGAKITRGTVIAPPVLVQAGARVLTNVRLGAYTYVGRNCIITHTQIAAYCSIAHDCQINYFQEHPAHWLSTHPFQYESANFAFWPDYARFAKQPFDDTQALVTIGPDVWMGAKSCIFGGVTIGAGAIVGARSLVKRDVAPYSVVAGTPARVIRHRFDRTIVDSLLELKWWELDPVLIRDLPYHDIEACLVALEELRCRAKK